MAFLYNASVCSQRPRASWKGTAVRPERFAAADRRACISLRRNVCTAVLILALAAPLGAQSLNCTLDALESNLPLRSVSVNESLGDFRFSCTGFGAGPVEINVFFDGPFTNRTVVRNGREITAAMAIVEGVTPETAVFQIPGEPRVPGANVFLLERRDDRIGERLFAEGLPGNRPLIISGARGDVEAALNRLAVRTGLGALTKNQVTLPDFTLSMVAANGQVAFDQHTLEEIIEKSFDLFATQSEGDLDLDATLGGFRMRSREEVRREAAEVLALAREFGRDFEDLAITSSVGDRTTIASDVSTLENPGGVSGIVTVNSASGAS